MNKPRFLRPTHACARRFCYFPRTLSALLANWLAVEHEGVCCDAVQLGSSLSIFRNIYLFIYLQLARYEAVIEVLMKIELFWE
jgi:hypothetical protein